MFTTLLPRTVRFGLAALLASAALSSSAQAADARSVIAARPELSEFSAFLDFTGQSDLLTHSGYTVFAPVNGSFAAYPIDHYPYLFGRVSPETREWAARIARNHIVPGNVQFDNVTAQKGGIFSVDNRHIAISQAHTSSKSPWGGKATIYVDGRRVLNSSMISGGMLHEIDGLIAQPWELTEIIPVGTVASAETTIVVPPGTDVTVTTY